MHQVLQGLARYKMAALALVGVAAFVVIVPAVRNNGDKVSDAGSSGAPSSAAPAVAVDAPAPVRQPGDTQAVPANCDEETGRIKFPSVYAPPCVYPVTDNGGATSKGVTPSTIKVVRYIPRLDPSVQALLRSNGAADIGANVDQQYDAWFDMFQGTYETYGRKVELQTFEATASPDDDAAARADAISVADMEPFIVIGGPEAFIDELANRGIICVTQNQGPIEFFQERAPYVYGTQMSSTQAFLHLAEYIGKRLDGKAVHAGSDELRSLDRKFGLIYAETPSGLYGRGVDALERELKSYGVTLAQRVSYVQDVATAQEQSRTIIARLKDADVTSVLFAGDAFAPIFLTAEATSQRYFPEWVIGGGNLVDTTALARRYNEQQWSNAFGVSQLWIRPPRDETEVYQQHLWFHDRPPFAGATFEILYQEPLLVFTGLHMAGPNLTPETYEQGMFNYPGGTGPFGTWGFDQDSYTPTQDYRVIYWDRNKTSGQNSKQGSYVEAYGGKRFPAGKLPSEDPKVFGRQ